MRLAGIFLVLSFSTALFGQSDDLQHDPNIAWIGEQTLDFELNPVYNNDLGEEYNLLELVRLENQVNTQGIYGEIEPGRYLSQQLLDALKAGAFDCFSDAQLTQPLIQRQVSEWLDHPGDLPGAEPQPEREAVQSTDIDVFRARMLLFFDTRKQAFGTRLLAVAPLLSIRDADGQITGRTPLLWIRMAQPDRKQQKVLQKKAAYVLQTRTKDNTPDWAEWDTRKGQLDLQAWATRETKHPAHPVLSGETFDPMAPQALQALIFTTDTLNTFNDDGQSVVDRIVQNNALEQVEKLRLVQHWYFDVRRKMLACRLVAVAPLQAVRNPEGRLRYYKPLFYVRY